MLKVCLYRFTRFLFSSDLPILVRNRCRPHDLWRHIHVPWHNAVFRCCSPGPRQRMTYTLTQMITLLQYPITPTGPLPIWPHPDHWAQQNLPFLRSETEATWDGLLHWWYSPRIFQASIYWGHCGSIWFPKFVWVCKINTFFSNVFTVYCSCRDFFPVIITFLRQLPFIGTALSLPYVRNVGPSSKIQIAQGLTEIPGGGSYGRLTNVCCLKSSIIVTSTQIHTSLASSITKAAAVLRILNLPFLPHQKPFPFLNHGYHHPLQHYTA